MAEPIRMQSVQTPIIPVVAEMTRANPGTISLGQGVVYYGPPPSRSYAATYLLARYSYMKAGAWQVKGSSQALADAYRDRILEMGGEIRTNTLVTAINVDDGEVLGVTTAAGEVIRSRYVERGLGLTVDLISRAGGSVHVEDEPGWTKAVVVRLPRAEVPEEEE